MGHVNVFFDVLERLRESGAARAAGPREPAGGRACAGAQRGVRGLGQGRCGEVHSDREPRGGAERRRQARGRARRGRVGLLDPAHVRARSDPAPGLRAAQDNPPGGPRGEGDVDRVLRGGGRGGGVAGADAAQGALAVPAGRGMGELDHLLIDLPPGTGDVSMTLAQLLPQARFVIVTTPQPAAQRVARRAAEMAHKVSLEIGGVIENMSGFTTPTGERYAIFGEGGGQELADELDVPLLGKVPLTMPLREHADSGVPLVLEDPDDPAAQAIRRAARGLIAMAPVELPILESPLAPVNGATPPEPTPPASPTPAGMSLPMA